MKKKATKLLALALTLVVLCAILAGCGGANEIKVGMICPTTGDTAFLGEMMKTLTDYVQKEINEAGGINGKKVSILIEDDAGNSAGAATAAQKLMNVDKVSGVVGPLFTTCVLAAKPIAEEAKTPIVVGTSAHKDIFAENGYIFSIDAANEVSINLLSQFLYYEKGFTKLSMLGNYNDQTLDMIGHFERFWDGYGGTVETSATFNPGTEDFRTELTKVKEAAPDVLWLSADLEEIKAIVRQMSELGLDDVYIATDYQAIQEGFFDQFGEVLDGRICYTQNGVASDAPTREKYEKFISGYVEMYGSDPDPVLVLYYDCFQLLFEALKTSGNATGEKLREALAATDGFVGASGYITFDTWGRSEGSSTILEYKDGKAELVPYTLR